jgi:hypothetical protein
MVTPETIQECKKIWVNSQFRDDINKFEELDDAYTEVLQDIVISDRAYMRGKTTIKNIIRDFYQEALKILLEMKKIAVKINDTILIDFVDNERKKLFEKYGKYNR